MSSIPQQIVGQSASSGNDEGYLWHNGQFTTINAPNAVSTDITSINDNGDLAGWYIDAGGTFHGFEALAVPEPGTAILMVTGLTRTILLMRRFGR